MSLPGRPLGEGETLAATTESPTPRRLGVAATLGASATPPPDDDSRTLAATHLPVPTADALPVAAERFAFSGRDDYLILGQFARGGIGRILRAHDPRLDRPVALKELLVHGRPVDEERFIREVLLTARLQHPGIVPVYAAGRWPSGEPFYAMKLVSGRSFDKVIAEARGLAARLALLPHVLVIAETVAYAHSQRILHRDLKPHNVLVGEFGETVVIDWGLAKELDAPDDPPPADAPPLAPTTVLPAKDLTFVGAVVGTPGYMSPEQAAGETVDARTDVYALGAILYHVLTGALPFDASNAMNLVYKTVYEDPIPLRAREPDAPEELVAIVDKAMAKDPAKRYPSAKEFADDLRRFQTGQIVGAHRYTAWERVRRFARKNRTVLGLAALSVLLIVIVTAVSFRQIAAERDAANDARDDARAAEQRTQAAYAEAERRADKLAFEQAGLLLDADAPEALRLLHHLSPQADWRRIRQIATDIHEHGVPVVLRGHRAAISRAAFSPDSAYLATTSDDCTVRVWDLSRRTSRTFYGHTSEVWRAAWSRDQTRLVTSSRDATVRVWDLRTGEAQVLSGLRRGARNVAFSPDGATVYASDDDQQLHRWDLATGAAELVLDRCSGNNSRWTERHALCIGAGTDVLHVIDLATGERAEFATGTALGSAAGVSPDGRWLAATTKIGRLWLWDREAAAGGLLTTTPPGTDTATFIQRELRFSAGSDRFVAPADTSYLYMRDLATGAFRWLEPHDGYTRRTSISTDGDLVISVGGDSNVGVWHVPTAASYKLVSARTHLIDAQISPDGRWIAGVGNDPRVFLWSPGDFLREQWATLDPQTGVVDGMNSLTPGIALVPSAGGIDVVDTARITRVRQLPRERPVITLAASGDTALAAAVDEVGQLTVWSIATGEPVLRRDLGRCADYDLFPEPGGRRFLVYCRDGALRWLDPAAREPLTELGSYKGSLPVAFVADPPAVVFGTSVGTLYVSDGPGAPPRVLRDYNYPLLSIAAVPGHLELIVSMEDIVERIGLDGATRTQYRGHRLQVGSVYVTEDTRWVTTVSRDNMIRMFDRETGALRVQLFSPELLERYLALAPDGGRVAAAVTNGEVLVWDIREDGGDVAQRGFRRLPGDRKVIAMVLAPDGSLLVRTPDRIIRWRDDLPAEPDAVRRWIADHVDDADPPKSEIGCASPE